MLGKKSAVVPFPTYLPKIGLQFFSYLREASLTLTEGGDFRFRYCANSKMCIYTGTFVIINLVEDIIQV